MQKEVKKIIRVSTCRNKQKDSHYWSCYCHQCPGLTCTTQTATATQQRLVKPSGQRVKFKQPFNCFKLAWVNRSIKLASNSTGEDSWFPTGTDTVANLFLLGSLSIAQMTSICNVQNGTRNRALYLGVTKGDHLSLKCPCCPIQRRSSGCTWARWDAPFPTHCPGQKIWDFSRNLLVMPFEDQTSGKRQFRFWYTGLNSFA